MRRVFALIVLAAACRGPTTVEVTNDPVRADPVALDVGNAYLGHDHTAELLLINPNKTPMEVSVAVTGPFEASLASVTLEGGVAAKVKVTFRPTAEGVATGTLTANALEVPLAGKGVKPVDCGVPAVCKAVAFNPRTGGCDVTALDDGTACTSSSACFASASCAQGECRGTLSTCDDGDKCTLDMCGTSGCLHSAPITCPALNDPCQVPTCVPALGCTSNPVADGTACGAVDCVRARVCISGTCASRAVPRTPACTDWEQEAYLKAFNSGAGDAFGHAVAVSDDGNTVVIGAWLEDSVNGQSPDNNSVFESGAVYVFTRQGIDWTQSAFLKASNPGTGDRFGVSVALSADGASLVVGADSEDSNGTESSNAVQGAGAAYVFTRSGNTWTQQAYLKAATPQPGDAFGSAVAISGNRIIVGAPGRTLAAGAVFPFDRTGTQWVGGPVLKAASALPNDAFGSAVALSGEVAAIGAKDTVFVFRQGVQEAALVHPGFGAAVSLAGNTLAVGNPSEEAVHVYTFVAAAWTMDATLHASNGDSFDAFGAAVALSSDGATLVVGAGREDSSGAEPDNTLQDSGAGYVFRRAGTWSQLRYLKAANRGAGDVFGGAVGSSSDGTTVVLGAVGEGSNATRVEGDGANNAATYAGAAYVF